LLIRHEWLEETGSVGLRFYSVKPAVAMSDLKKVAAAVENGLGTSSVPVFRGQSDSSGIKKTGISDVSPTVAVASQH
jgi:hypothetical protein